MEISFEIESELISTNGEALILIVVADIPEPHDIWVFNKKTNGLVLYSSLNEEDQAKIMARIKEAEAFLDDANEDWQERHWQADSIDLVRELNRKNGH